MAKTNWHPSCPRRGSGRLLMLAGLLFATLVTVPADARPSRKPIVYKWAHVPVAHVPPSQLFKVLGLTHITRLGSTRKSWEDPGFPKDLTDVVPYDSQHVMLMRGTESGLAAYQQVIAAADFAAQRWQLTIDLVRMDGVRELPVATQRQKDVGVDAPVTMALGTDPDTRTYRFRIASGTASTLQITCQPCFALPAVSAAPVQAAPPTVLAKPADTAKSVVAATTPAVAATTTPVATWSPNTTATPPATAATTTVTPPTAPATPPPIKAVLTPAMVSTAPMSKTVRPGETITFSDTAASRLAVLRKLGATGTTETVDYVIRITCTAAGGEAVAVSTNTPGANAPARP